MTTIYITKYALTQGILVKEARKVEDHIATVDGRYGLNIFHKNEWYLDRDSAVKRAEEMRLKKIESHRKSIAKLEKMRFDDDG